MTAYSRTEHEIYCDARLPSETQPRGLPCHKTYQPPEDTPAYPVPAPAKLRKLAAKDGWTHVQSRLGRRYDKDFCPEHKPEPEPEEGSR